MTQEYSLDPQETGTSDRHWREMTVNVGSQPVSSDPKASRVDLLLGALILIVTSGAGVQLFVSADDAYVGSSTLQVIYAVSYALVALRLFQQRRRALAAAFASPALCLLIVYSLGSYFWSDVPDITLRRGFALVGTFIASIHLAVAFTRNQQIKLLAWIFATILIASIVAAAFFPDYGLYMDRYSIAWQGIYLHKNGLGQGAAFSVLLWTILASRRRRWAVLAFGSMLLVSMLVLVMSDSASSVLVASCLVLLWFSVLILRARSIVAASAFSVALPCAILCCGVVILNADWILSLLGREITLTGRTELWPLVWTEFAGAPWFGHGYGAFWLGLQGPSRAIWSQLTWTPSHAHNGYLDTGLQLGIIGVSLLMVILVGSIVSSLRQLRAVRGAGEWFSVGVLLFTIVLNSVESTLLWQNNIFWVIVCAEFIRLSMPAAQLTEIAKGTIATRGHRAARNVLLGAHTLAKR
jgi:exopolysaccharide production protein ExoQ